MANRANGTGRRGKGKIMAGIDFLGDLFGKAVRRQLEREAAQGAGPILDVIKPVVSSLVQAEVAAQVAKAGQFVQQKTGVGNLAGLLGGIGGNEDGNGSPE